jgi:hypothetical protein
LGGGVAGGSRWGGPSAPPRVLRRIGPESRPSTARSTARPMAGGSGTRTTLVPLPTTRSTRWPCSSPRSPTSVPLASKILRPSRPSIATRAKSLGVRGLPGGGQHRLELQMRQAERGRLGRNGGPGDELRGGVLQHPVDDAGPVEAGQHRGPPGHRGRLVPASLLHDRTYSSRCCRWAPSGSMSRSAHEPRKRPQVRRRVLTGKAPEPGQVGRHCQRQPRVDGRSGFADVGIVPDTQRGWVKQAGIDAGALPGTTTSDARTSDNAGPERIVRRDLWVDCAVNLVILPYGRSLTSRTSSWCVRDCWCGRGAGPCAGISPK